jgi:hypothetical protein
MRTFILIGCLIFSGLQLTAQKLVNYNQKGEKLKSATEYVGIDIKIYPTSDQVKVVSPVIASVMLGPVFNIVTSSIKNGLEKRQKSYIASYANSKEFSGKLFKEGGLKSLIVTRYAISSLDNIVDDQLMAKYELALSEVENCLLIEAKDIFLKRSKARYKKDDNLAITINIKATSTTDLVTKDPDTKENKLESKSVDSEGTITIPIFKLTGDNQDLTGKGNFINTIRLNGITPSTSKYIKIAVNITETNITHIDPSIVQTILTNNNSDIQSILKAIFGVAEE